MILSMLIGGAVAQKEGMRGLSILIAGILVLTMFYGGIFGIIIGGVGILAILIAWLISVWNKPISLLYANKANKLKNDDWGKDIIKAANSNLKKRYPKRYKNL